MARINSRAKGATGERQFCKWLAIHLYIEGAERNLEQVRSGGADIVTDWFVFEIKRVENLDIAGAWRQVAIATKEITEREDNVLYREPVVAHRQNGKKEWSFCISAKHIGLDNGYVMLNERNFILWARKQLEVE